MRSLFIIVSISAINLCSADWSIGLEYSLDNFGHSYPLGNIEMRRTFDGNYSATFRSKTDNQLATQLKQNKDSVYRIRSTGQEGSVLTSFTKPCLLLQSNLYHLFWVAVDSDRQLVHSITVFPDVVAAGGELDSRNCGEHDSVSGEAHGTVHVHNKDNLPSPDTQSFVKKLENEKRARQHGAETDNRSFIGKYWMYIVPIVIFMVMSNLANPDGGQAAE